MKRCAICDYAEGVGSDMLGIRADSRRVLWKETHQEFQCDVCATSIKETIIQQELDDAEKAIAEDADDITDGDIEICGVPPTLSEVPF